MQFAYSKTCQEYLGRVRAFMDAHVYPNERTYHEQLKAFGDNRWQVLPVIEDLKAKAKAEGLWNLFLPDSEHGAGLSNADYAPLAEEMGRVVWASEVFNCSAPDTGNMEVLARYGSVLSQFDHQRRADWQRQPRPARSCIVLAHCRSSSSAR